MHRDIPDCATAMRHDPNAGPNLFLVGAQKCGTTSMYEYLRQHPQIFFPAARALSGDEGHLYMRMKEPHHFCPDLPYGEHLQILDRAAYLDLYRNAGQFKWRGDATPHYLFSESAPQLIKEFCPDARILIMLRPPLEMMRSSHKDFLRTHWEDIEDLHEAIAAWPDRREGRSLPPRCPCPELLDYRSLACFAPQVKRWIDTFEGGVVKVILLEDLMRAPDATYGEIIQFLNLDATFCPSFRIYNEAPGGSAGERLMRLVYQIPLVNRFARATVPYGVRRSVLGIIRHNAAHGHTDADPRDKQLKASCSVDIQRLGALINRNLDHWL